MSNRLNVLITGATSGFGRQTAEKLASDGHQVFAMREESRAKMRTPPGALNNGRMRGNLT